MPYEVITLVSPGPRDNIPNCNIPDRLPYAAAPDITVTVFTSGNVYFLIHFTFFTPPPTSLSCGDHQSVLCIYEFLSVLLVHLL